MIAGIRTLADITDVRGKRVFARLDLNVPIVGGKIRDPFRIDAALPTVAMLRDKGAKIVLASHIGKSAKDTLRPVADYLAQKFPLTFLPHVADPRNREAVERLREGNIILLENLRSHPGEESNDPTFAQLLSSLADHYVNDAFSVAHRSHASVVGIPKLLPGVLGLQFEKEIKNLSAALKPAHPFLFILGGAKIATKLPLLKKFLRLADTVFVGGTLANTLLSASGKPMGVSVYDKDAGDLRDVLSSNALELPDDVVVKREGGALSVSPDRVAAKDMIVDVGRGAVQALRPAIASAKLIVWNGPLGFYEEGFKEGTQELLRLIAESKAVSVIGGGDTVAVIDEMKMEDRFTFVSTGGGAMLDYLANETLPGLEALKK